MPSDLYDPFPSGGPRNSALIQRTMYSGIGAPTSTEGIPPDSLYIDEASGSHYKNESGTWTLKFAVGGGGAAQTPWTSAINGGGFALTNVSSITATTVNANLVGNVTGNITGNLTGTVTGAASLNVLKAGDTMTGALLFSTDNTIDIGASGATRPRTGYFGTSLVLGVSGIFVGGTNTIEQRNGTNGQTQNLYNTYTDASNYERFATKWAANVLTIGTENAGTGAARAMQFQIGGTSICNFAATGHLLWNTDNTYDIGATTATRPRGGYFATTVKVGANAPGDTNATISATSAAAGTEVRLGMFETSSATTRSEFTVANSATSASWTNNFLSFMVHGASYAGNNYLGDGAADAGNAIILAQGSAVTMLAIGCNSSIPINFFTANTRRWQIAGAGHLICPTDNTYDIGASAATRPRNLFIAGTADIAGVATLASGVATPAGGSTAARLIFGTTAGFGIYYGSGAPTVSAAQGSIFLRSDGSSTSTRLYVNTTGSTTWTNFTSAA